MNDGRLRVLMLKSRDQLYQGLSYNVPAKLAEELVRNRDAVLPDEPKRPVGPSETKPAFPSELKDQKTKKKKLHG
jgi:hypothetical protein